MPEDEKEGERQQLTEADLRLMTDDELHDLLDVHLSASPIPEVEYEISRREPWSLRRAWRRTKWFLIYGLGRRKTQGKMGDLEWAYFRARFHSHWSRPVPWWRSGSEFRYWAYLFYVQPIHYRLKMMYVTWCVVEYHGLMPRKIVRWLDARAERRAAK